MTDPFSKNVQELTRQYSAKICIGLFHQQSVEKGRSKGPPKNSPKNYRG